MRHMIVKLTLIIFNRFQQGEFGICMLRETPRVKEPAFPFCLPFDYPFSEQFAMTAPFANASAQPRNRKGIALARNRANQRHPIRGIGDRAIYNRMNARACQSWQTFENTFHIIKASIKIIGAKRHGKIRVNAVHTKGFTALLIDANKQAFFLLARIKIITWIANNRHALFHLLKLFYGICEEIHMLHRDNRMLNAHHLANFICAITARIHNNLSADIPFFCMHNPVIRW